MTLSFIALKVYPRVCGGTTRKRWKIGLENGLSPRVRGNRLEDKCFYAVRRSIPACAGEPA